MYKKTIFLTAFFLIFLSLFSPAFLKAQSIENPRTGELVEGGGSWLIMVYIDGDNNLESYAIDDFLEMASVGSTADVSIVVQMDRIAGYSTEYEDWTGCARFAIEQGDTPVLANAEYWPDESKEKEVDMGDPQTLEDFVDWAMQTYPASHYALVLWNHGGGWRERI